MKMFASPITLLSHLYTRNNVVTMETKIFFLSEQKNSLILILFIYLFIE